MSFWLLGLSGGKGAKVGKGVCAPTPRGFATFATFPPVNLSVLTDRGMAEWRRLMRDLVDGQIHSHAVDRKMGLRLCADEIDRKYATRNCHNQMANSVEVLLQ